MRRLYDLWYLFRHLYHYWIRDTYFCHKLRKLTIKKKFFRSIVQLINSFATTSGQMMSKILGSKPESRLDSKLSHNWCHSESECLFLTQDLSKISLLFVCYCQPKNGLKIKWIFQLFRNKRWLHLYSNWRVFQLFWFIAKCFEISIQ